MAKTFPNVGLLIFRVLISSMMLFHGIPKIEKLFSLPVSFADPLGVGSTTSLILTLIGEVLAPIFIIVGFKTRWASIPAAITMLVAAFVVHIVRIRNWNSGKLLVSTCRACFHMHLALLEKIQHR